MGLLKWSLWNIINTCVTGVPKNLVKFSEVISPQEWMDKFRINTCQRKFIFRGTAQECWPNQLMLSTGTIRNRCKRSVLDYIYILHGDTHIVSNHYSGEFPVLSHLTLLNSKPLVRGSRKSTGHIHARHQQQYSIRRWAGIVNDWLVEIQFFMMF